MGLIADASRPKKILKKKRVESDLDLGNTVDDGNVEAIDALCVDNGLDEPTMGEKLVSLNLFEDNKAKSSKEEDQSPVTELPSADSVHVLLKQALHADDHALLLDCLYTQDEKVIAKSISLLNSLNVLKFLNSLISIMHSRGAVLACALPWLRSLLLQHASAIMSQESSLLALNSLYQLIESRVSTFQPALQLSSCLDYIFVGISDDMDDEMNTVQPIIYEDEDESDEDIVETDQENEEHEAITGFCDFEGSDEMNE